MAYEQRRYRVECRGAGLVPFSVQVKETDLWILAERELRSEALEEVLAHRRVLEAYALHRPGFLESLRPLEDDPLAPAVARAMLRAALVAGTGPMAAVAGAMAQAVGLGLKRYSRWVVVENGGDIYLDAPREVVVGIWAGESVLSGRVGLRVDREGMPVGIGTSSATVGHSLSMGRADAAVVLARDAALADALATALGNRVGGKGAIAEGLEWISRVEGVRGAVVIVGEKLGAWGDVELVEL